jgi:uncharacterized protein (DUF1015 family)
MPGVMVDRTHVNGNGRAATAGGLTLAPFRGVRFDLDRIRDIARVTAPPYDVIEPEDREALETADPHNIVRLILPRSTAGDPEQRYRKAAQTLQIWLAERILVTDTRPALYVYEQDAGARLQRGLIGALGLRDPKEGIVLPHEEVLPGPVADRLGLMRAAGANLEPILLRYDGGGEAADAVDEATEGPPLVATTTVDGAVHRLWRVTDERALRMIASVLAGRQALIADGHHRYATYLQLQAEHHAAGHGPGPWDFGLALLVDAARYPLELHAIHRVIAGLPAARAAELATAHAAVEELSAVEHVDVALARLADVTGPAFLLEGAGRRWLVSNIDAELMDQAVPKDRPEIWRQLDATVLDHLFIPHIWAVADPPVSVSHHHIAPPALRLAEMSGGTAVLMRPVDVTTVLELARQGVRMPRKSTSFGPKPRSGFVLRTFASG